MHYKDKISREQMMVMSYETMIASENVVRLIDALCKKYSIEQQLNEKWKGQSNEGQKSYPPDSMLKLLVYGYFNGIASSRKLEKETYRNIEMIWLMEGLQPDHWTICEFRRESGIIMKDFLRYFRKFLIDNKYTTGEKVVFDGTKIKAYADRKMLTAEKITEKLENIDKSLNEYLSKIESADNYDEKLETAKKEIEELKEKIEKLENLKAKYEQYDKELKKTGKKYYSPSDPEAIMVKGREGKFCGYNGQIGVEGDNHFILSDRVTCNENDKQELVEDTKVVIEETGIIPKEVSADKGFGTYSQILKVEENGITECYIPLEKTTREKQELKGINFIYNSEDDTYICPMGKKLTLFSLNCKNRSSYYNIYKCHECSECSIKANCTKSKSGRIINRNINQDKIDIYKKKMKGQYAKEKVKERKTVVEHPFGTIKMLMGKFNFLLRGKEKVQIEFDYYTFAYNLKRLIGCASISNLMVEMGKYSI